jgi:hypothetical protein
MRLDMETKDWIQLVLGAATLLTAGAALANVIILRKQRRDAQKPILQLKDKYYAHDVGNMILPKDVKIESGEVPSFGFTIVNSGHGVANNISIDCYYDIQKFLFGFNAELFADFGGGEGVYFKEDDETVFTFDLFRWKTINYILPFNNEEEASFELDNVYEAFLLRFKDGVKHFGQAYALFAGSILYVRMIYHDSLNNRYVAYFHISHHRIEGSGQIVFSVEKISRRVFKKSRKRIRQLHSDLPEKTIDELSEKQQPKEGDRK